MNSSFLVWGQFLVGSFSLLQTVCLLAQFGFPRDTVRFLGVLMGLALSLSFLAEGVAVFGFFPVFHFEALYGVLSGVLTFSLVAFTYLGVVDHPGQLQRKIMWRLPLVGALIGYWITPSLLLLLLLSGWVFSVAMLFTEAHRQRYVLRLFFSQLSIGIAYYGALRLDWWWVAVLSSAAWTIVFYRYVSAFLVKNLARKFAPPVIDPSGASA